MIYLLFLVFILSVNSKANTLATFVVSLISFCVVSNFFVWGQPCNKLYCQKFSILVNIQLLLSNVCYKIGVAYSCQFFVRLGRGWSVMGVHLHVLIFISLAINKFFFHLPLWAWFYDFQLAPKCQWPVDS